MKAACYTHEIPIAVRSGEVSEKKTEEKSMANRALILLFGLFAGAIALNATLLTSKPAGTATTVLTTVSGTHAESASVVANGFTITGSQVWYGDSLFGLGGNGSWNSFAWVGGDCFTGSCEAVVNLGGLFSSVGGFMSYSTQIGVGGPSGPGDPTITALAADGTTVLETDDLDSLAPIDDNGINHGEFRGISQTTNDIAFLKISGSYLVMHDLSLGTTTVPEPASFGVVFLALGILAGLRRRRTESVTRSETVSRDHALWGDGV